MNSGRPKVFGIGFHKTATSTLADVLGTLGYSVTGPDWVTEADVGLTHLEKCRERSKKFDAFQNNPWPLVYKEMDEMWPGAKFILTTRHVDKWIASQVNHFAKQSTPMRRYIYGEDCGFPAGNEERYIQVYNDHNAAVRKYFEGREKDFLEIDLTTNSDWEPICAFLEADVPETPFPHVNSAQNRTRNHKLWRRATRKLKRLLLPS